MQDLILIAGGGIGGAVLAETLARRGRRVMVLEKSTGPPGFVRPEIAASLRPFCVCVGGVVHA